MDRFKVDIEIYEDKLDQSGDRILSSHITKLFVACPGFFPRKLVTGSMYIKHFHCLVVEANFNSYVLECLPVDPATWVRFPAGVGKIFSLYDILLVTKIDFTKKNYIHV